MMGALGEPGAVTRRRESLSVGPAGSGPTTDTPTLPAGASLEAGGTGSGTPLPIRKLMGQGWTLLRPQAGHGGLEAPTPEPPAPALRRGKTCCRDSLGTEALGGSRNRVWNLC